MGAVNKRRTKKRILVKPRRYAAETEVAVSKSKRQIEDLLVARKVEQYHTGWDDARDIIEFGWKGKQIRFVLKRPDPKRLSSSMLEQADRQRWRALYLVVRAKIEAVEAGLAIFEEEFLAFIVVPGSNQTIGEIMVPRLNAGDFNVARALPAQAGA